MEFSEEQLLAVFQSVDTDGLGCISSAALHSVARDQMGMADEVEIRYCAIYLCMLLFCVVLCSFCAQWRFVD